MAGMVSRDNGMPRAVWYMLPYLLGFAAGEFVGGFIAGFLITQFKKWGGFFGYGIDGHRAGTYTMPSAKR